MELQEVLNTPFHMEDIKVTLDGKTQVSQLGLPDVETLKAALEFEELAIIIKAFSAYGFRSFLRNSLKANRGNFTNFADVLRIQQEAAEAKGGNTEALALRQAFIKDFVARLKAAGVKPRGVELLTTLIRTPAAMEMADDFKLGKLTEMLNAFQSSEGYDTAYDTVMAKLADTISEHMGSEDEDEDLF